MFVKGVQREEPPASGDDGATRGGEFSRLATECFGGRLAPYQRGSCPSRIPYSLDILLGSSRLTLLLHLPLPRDAVIPHLLGLPLPQSRLMYNHFTTHS